MAGQRSYLPLLVGLGLDEVSVSAPAIGGLKAKLLRLKLADCRQLLATAVEYGTAGEVGSLCNRFSAQHSAPLLAPELIVVDADVASKEEAIKRAVDLLYIHGRTEQPRLVEHAVWQREASYSTGFGHGFAIPHCKTGAVLASSLVLLKLREPIAWDSLDEAPVRVVILLVIRDVEGTNEHMKVIASLARQVMHEDFRARLEQESEPGAICRLLSKKMAG